MKLGVDEKNFLYENAASNTLNELFELFSRKFTKNQIYSYCRNANLSIKKIDKETLSKTQSENSRKHNINKDFFKTWSNDMAYVLGFWYADGCIYSGKMFDITTHKKDKYILKKIAERMKYEGDIEKLNRRSAYRLNFSCVQIYRDIVKIGGTERKSLIIEFPEIPDQFLSHFIRGYFDGDGCIMNLKNNRINSAFTSGSKKFLVQLLKTLKEKAGVTGGSFDDSCCSLKFGKRDTYLIGSFMYKDCGDLYLSRKKIKFN